MSDPVAPITRRLGRRRVDPTPYFFVAPICILLLAISVYPMFYAVWLAMTDAKLMRLSRAAFIGLDNFLRMSGDPIFIGGIWKTLRWDLVVVLTELAVALPMALFLDLRFRGRGILRAIVVTPYIVPPAVVSLMWIYMFDGNFGVVNDLLVRSGAVDAPISWLSDPNGAFAIVAAAMVWAGTPLMVIILLAVIQTVPKELFEAARVDGAGAWMRFRYVTLPAIIPTIMFLLLMRTIWMSNHIDMIFVMTRGGPGFANYTEALYAFMVVQQFDIGYASAIAVALAVVLLCGSAFYVRHLAASVLSR